ncbi:type IV toxin-antitoxin system AbiEi family antitoxin [Vibrio atlanticus]|uniref:Type IV toxin-antitoxin system AbiEi family antitoxin n=1 Tax=Vibrio atlanticus TaxID=693153 RepID=A0ABV4KWP3_9VIBR
MKQSEAIKRLHEWDIKGRYVYQHRDLRKVFHEDADRAFNESLKRLVKNRILERVARGVYVYSFSNKRKSGQNLELIAKTLRRGEYNYISLDSALSEYGIISQIPMDRLTVMTTGRKGEYKTSYGLIEFTHTKRSVTDILDNIHSVGRALRIASQQAAVRDLKRVGRNVHLSNVQ